MTDKGLVTVIVPVFNVEEYLEKCIKVLFVKHIVN